MGAETVGLQVPKICCSQQVKSYLKNSETKLKLKATLINFGWFWSKKGMSFTRPWDSKIYIYIYIIYMV